MTGTIRTFDAKVLERTLRRVEDVVAGVTAAMGANMSSATTRPARCS